MKLIKKDKDLIKIAQKNSEKVKRALKKKIGEVGSVLITKKGNVYFGISADLMCGLGGCAERSSILSMLSNGETEIDTIVAVYKNKIYPPCGVCREMILQLNRKNLNTNIIISNSKKVKLKDLLPNRWQEISGEW